MNKATSDDNRVHGVTDEVLIAVDAHTISGHIDP